jgi:hypothetical protein
MLKRVINTTDLPNESLDSTSTTIDLVESHFSENLVAIFSIPHQN